MTLFACCARLCRKANERPLAEKVCDGLRDKFKRYLEGWLVSPNKKLHQEFATEFEFGRGKYSLRYLCNFTMGRKNPWTPEIRTLKRVCEIR